MFGWSIARFYKHNDRCERQYRPRASTSVCPSQAGFTIFQVQTLFVLLKPHSSSSGGFEGLETFFEKKNHLFSSLSSFSLSSSLFFFVVSLLFSSLHLLSSLFSLVLSCLSSSLFSLHSCLVSSSPVLSCFLFFCLLFSCLSPAVFSSLCICLCLCLPLSLSLSVSVWCCGRVVVLCCVLCFWCVWCGVSLSSGITDAPTFEMELCGHKKQATAHAHVRPHCVCD